MRALDLFCGAGGVSVGLERAGFEVTGVDISPQPRYRGGTFIQADALTFPLDGYDFIWASPPCQAFTAMRRLGKRAGEGAPDLIDAVRARLAASSATTAIENVPEAPLRQPFQLCGSAFGLGVRRHRRFEVNFPLFEPPPRCQHKSSPRPIGVYGDHPQTNGDHTFRVNRAGSLAEGQEAMGIDWMVWRELTQAIPPAYAEWIGRQALAALSQGAA